MAEQTLNNVLTSKYSVLIDLCQDCNLMRCTCNYDNLLIDTNASGFNQNVSIVANLPEATSCVRDYNVHKEVRNVISEKVPPLSTEHKQANDKSSPNSFGLSKRGLKIANLNIQHLIPKFDEIQLLLKEKKSNSCIGDL